MRIEVSLLPTEVVHETRGKFPSVQRHDPVLPQGLAVNAGAVSRCRVEVFYRCMPNAMSDSPVIFRCHQVEVTHPVTGNCSQVIRTGHRYGNLRRETLAANIRDINPQHFLLVDTQVADAPGCYLRGTQSLSSRERNECNGATYGSWLPSPVCTKRGQR